LVCRNYTFYNNSQRSFSKKNKGESKEIKVNNKKLPKINIDLPEDNSKYDSKPMPEVEVEKPYDWKIRTFVAKPGSTRL